MATRFLFIQNLYYARVSFKIVGAIKGTCGAVTPKETASSLVSSSAAAVDGLPNSPPSSAEKAGYAQYEADIGSVGILRVGGEFSSHPTMHLSQAEPRDSALIKFYRIA